MSDKKTKFSKKIAYLLIFVMFFQISAPAYALTEGPSQPEFNSFTPIGTSDMVDLATGDFNYNIPIMNVGGYPINLAYNSGVTMDQEASWVGLGWNLNVGQINREVRGIPDDFKGDILTSENNMKTNFTVAVNPYFNPQIIGALDNVPVNLGGGLNIKYNNYDGVSVTPSYGLSFELSDNVTVGMNLSSSNAEGVTVAPYTSLHHKKNKTLNSSNKIYGGFSAGISYNSRQGLEAFSLSSNIAYKRFPNNKFNNLSRASSGSISFLNQTFTPVKRLAYKNISGTAAVSLGPDVFGGHVEGTISASVSIQELKNKTQHNKAYGYEYTEFATDEDIMDFNREKEKSTISQNTTVLPVTNYTYDVYTIQGQGIGGSFKSFKSQVGHVYDPKVTDQSESYSIGVEIEGGAGAHIGGNFKTNTSNTYTGRWNTNVAAFFKENKTDNNPNHLNYEKTYFKKVGNDGSGVDPEYTNIFESKLGGNAPIAIKIGASKQPEANYLKKNEVSSSPTYQDVKITTPIKRQQRVMRNQTIQKFTQKDVDSIITSPNIKTPKLLNYIIKPNKNGKPHHTAGYIITDEYGNRHVYGESVYNIEKQEVSFSVGSTPRGENKDKELIIYQNGDNTESNNKGKDNFFNKEKTPEYAHTYLISSILDVNYEDRTGNGPSDDDLGNYTQFFYENKEDYKWRIPYEQNTASYNNGFSTKTTDQKGSYLYGEKEIKYLQRIVTKTHIAYFDLDQRKDGYGVAGENGGGSDLAPLYKIKSIRLYSKPELIVAGVDLETGPLDNSIKPIKTAHFRYNYDLCIGVDNNLGNKVMLDSEIGENNGGKLTLKKVYFTYKNSNMGMYTPYEFEYNNEKDTNASYNIKNYDIWGNYKKRKANSYYDNNSGHPTPQEFPYVQQYDKGEQDNLASVWSLKTIILPSKGKINIGYESDDYQYVQDRKAMRMYMVEGVSINATIGGIKQELYDHHSESKYIVIRLDPSDTKTTANNFKERYIGNQMNKPIFFNFLLNTINNKYDHVEGYFKIDPNRNIELKNSGSDRFIFIPMQFLDIEGGIASNQQVNPISKAGWYFARQYLNLEIGTGQSYNSFNVVEIAKSLASSIGNIVEVFTGPNKKLRYKKVASSFKPNKSWIRLLEPTGSKLGGGARVKTIELHDSWEQMTDVIGDIQRYKKRYGQEYKYTLEDGTSSGVASYEPNYSKENPFVEPFYDKNDRLVAPKEVNYTEKPFGESFFPSPVVTYSRVEVKNISADTEENTASTSVTGKVVTEHYTFKDFPVITDHTELNNDLMKFTSNQDEAVSNMLKGMLGLKVETKSDLVISQGFYIETNDMNGKLKKQSVYDHGGSLISSIEHQYKIKEGYPDRLENTVPVLDRNGNISEKVLGVHYDVINDFRKSYSKMDSFGVNVNVDLIPLGIFPIIIGFGVPERAEHIQELKTVVTTKVVHKVGLLEKSIAFDLGSTIKTKNIAWDQDTGQVILTETNNEFDDNYYNFNYPAYWYVRTPLFPHIHWYEGNNNERMQHASKNIDFQGTLVHQGDGSFKVYGYTEDLSKYFTFGDELVMNETSRAWVYAFKDDSFERLVLIDNYGFFINPDPEKNEPQSYKFRIIKSGNRNNLKDFMASVTSMVNPIDPNNDGELQNLNSDTYNGDSWKVVNASAVEYSDIWRFFCQGYLFEAINETRGDYMEFAGVVNPYINNYLGNFRVSKTYKYLTGRNSTTESNTRHSGFYKDFNAFYKPNPEGWIKNLTNSAVGWQFINEVSLYYPSGMEAENRDALQVYSSAQYEYNYTLPIAVTKNGKYRQMGFEGFEDFSTGYYNSPKHFGYTNHVGEDANPIPYDIHITNSHSHTGNYSMRIPTDTLVSKVIGHEQGCACQSFTLVEGKSLISAWVKEVSHDGRQFKHYENSLIRLESLEGNPIGSLYPSGPVINGWQKIEGVIEVIGSDLHPTSLPLRKVILHLENRSGEFSTISYFDDLRVHAAGAIMKSFVYDKKTQLLMAELDENNYATFYQYDKEGGLIRVKKETEKGIFTIQETRSNTVKR